MSTSLKSSLEHFDSGLDDSNPVTEGTPPPLVPVGTEGERSEPECTTGTNGGGRGTPPPRRLVTAPDPEVVERAVRRTYTAEYKERILDEVEAATDPGAVGRILRREGLYSSNLTDWREKRNKGGRAALEPSKRGPKPADKNPLHAENAKLKRENALLQKKLQTAEVIINLQKKVSEILGITLPVLEQIDNDDEVDS
jgi:transposase-like protein